MRHVPAHRLADAEAGRLDPEIAARIDAHVAECSRCAAARARLREAREAMAAIAETPEPELGWDHIGARIYWSRSTQLRAAAQRPRRWLPWAGVGAGALAAALGLSWWLVPETSEPAPVARVSQAGDEGEAVALVSEPAPRALAGLVTFAAGDARLDGRPLGFDALVVEGAVLQTGSGRLAVQFGAHSGFSLGPGSRLTLAAFSRERIALQVDGVIDVDISRRPPGQVFEVVAGEQRVVVRGTAFRVGHRGGELEVTCTRGEVVVEGGGGDVGVRAGERLQAGERPRAVPLSARELAAIEQSLRVPLLPAFTGAEAMLETSAALEVSAPASRAVTVDGAVVGEGSFQVRVMRGRHLVAGAGGPGIWVETRDHGPGVQVAEPPEQDRADAAAEQDRADAVAEPVARGAARLRRRQLAAAVDRAGRARRCLDTLAKQGLMAGAYAVFDLGVAADGAQSHLNLVDSNLSPAIEDCLRRALDAAALPPGPPARFRYRLAF